MKKMFKISVMALLLSVLIPLNVKALDAEIFGSNVSMTETTEGGNSFAIEQKGESVKLYLGVNVKEGTFNDFNAHVELKNSNFSFSGTRSDYTLSSGWTGTITKSETGNGIDVKLTHKDGLTAGTRKIVATISLTIADDTPSTEKCEITIEGIKSTPETPVETPKCKVVDGKYYDANGVEVSEEAYNAACTTSENPQTGSFLPYTLIIAGLVLAGWLYYVTKKNNKMYQV